VNVADGGITMKGEKKEETEEKKKDYYVSERRYGSFERYFTLPEGVDANKIEATFTRGRTQGRGHVVAGVARS